MNPIIRWYKYTHEKRAWTCYDFLGRLLPRTASATVWGSGKGSRLVVSPPDWDCLACSVSIQCLSKAVFVNRLAAANSSSWALWSELSQKVWDTWSGSRLELGSVFGLRPVAFFLIIRLFIFRGIIAYLPCYYHLIRVLTWHYMRHPVNTYK